VRAYPSDALAVAGAAAGEGVTLAVAHTILDALRRPSLGCLDVRGTPVSDLWFASTRGSSRSLPAADALLRFLRTPAARRAILTSSSGVPAARLRLSVHVTLWSSVASQAGGGGARATGDVGQGS